MPRAPLDPLSPQNYPKKMRIKGYSDLFIRWLFGAEENNEYLLSFLNALQEYEGQTPLRSVLVRNPFLLQRAYDDKLAVLDVLAEAEDGLQFNVEVQASNHAGFEERTLYYWARVYSGQIDSSDKYTKLNPVVGVNIVNFVLFPGIPRPVNTFHLTHDQNPELRLTEHLTVHYLELPKLRAEAVPERKLERWMAFLKHEGEEGFDMKVLLHQDNDLQKAHDRYHYFASDADAKARWESHWKWQIDQNQARYDAQQAGLAEGRAEGLEEGRAEGKAEGKAEGRLELAQELVAKGLAPEEVSQLTGIPVARLTQQS